MACKLKINVNEEFTGFTVKNSQNEPYKDKKNNLLLKDLAAGPSLFEIIVELDEKNKAVVYVDATKPKSVPSSTRYNIPDDCAPGGNIYVPKIAAALQSDLDKLAEHVQELTSHIAGDKRGR
ncbi:hypothetical protein AMC78_PC00113 (plasmid) [Rhizobium phaseoli]|uniref:hypothetical protein n=1 Tax=Rhizobium phaseoli TaxID=396 RepID=UPI0007EB6D8E|nr:hypothetical protein [Rhizobium phaseoli]ANM07254.1 hypothetical protein AMC78_PC00113 [Rhizobium phaseoli]